MIYDDVVAETLIQPLPDVESPVETEPVADLPPAVHDAMTCDVCKAWLAHIRDAEAT